jgi:hypothetical protein
MQTFIFAFLAGLIWCVLLLWDLATGSRFNRAVWDFFGGSSFGGVVLLLCLLLIAWQSLAWFVGLFGVRGGRHSTRRQGDL